MISNLNLIHVFIKVVEKQSFTAAAEALCLTKSVVSRHVNHLEEELGVKLLHRTTRRITLTEVGALYYQRCSGLIEEIENVSSKAQLFQNEPSGTLRISAPMDFGNLILTSMISSFMREFPKIEVELILTDKKLDLIQENLDMVIRVGWLRDSSMISTKLGKTRQLVCSSKKYLEHHPIPKQPSDLTHHNWITLTELPNHGRWTFSTPDNQLEVVTLKGNIQTNNAVSVGNFVKEGMGISALPEFTIVDSLKEGTLQVLLEDYKLEDVGIYAVYPTRDYLPLKVRTFIDHIKTHLA